MSALEETLTLADKVRELELELAKSAVERRELMDQAIRAHVDITEKLKAEILRLEGEVDKYRTLFQQQLQVRPVVGGGGGEVHP